MSGGAVNSIKQVVAVACGQALTCEACGNQFNCGASLSGCWCASIDLSEETRAELKSRYSGCLCEQCLRKFQEAKK